MLAAHQPQATQPKKSAKAHMLNFDFRRVSKKCSESERILQPGEEFYSALIGDETDSQRFDFSVECWDGPPENCLGWWKSKIPTDGKGKIHWAPRSVLLAYFDHVRRQPTQSDVAYVMALLLTQKKILAFADSLDEQEAGTMQLKNRKDNEIYKVAIAEVSPQRLKQIQDELAERLFTDQPFDVLPNADETE